MLLAELKTGEWSLVIANVALTGVDGPAFITLRELATVSAEEGGRIRALFWFLKRAEPEHGIGASRLLFFLRSAEFVADLRRGHRSLHLDEEVADFSRKS